MFSCFLMFNAKCTSFCNSNLMWCEFMCCLYGWQFWWNDKCLLVKFLIEKMFWTSLPWRSLNLVLNAFPFVTLTKWLKNDIFCKLIKCFIILNFGIACEFVRWKFIGKTDKSDLFKNFTESIDNNGSYLSANWLIGIKRASCARSNWVAY